MKKAICLFLIAGVLFTFTACAKKKKLHCDNCQKEVTVKESSDMQEDWLVYCGECNEKLFGDDPVLGNN